MIPKSITPRNIITVVTGRLVENSGKPMFKPYRALDRIPSEYGFLYLRYLHPVLVLVFVMQIPDDKFSFGEALCDLGHVMRKIRYRDLPLLDYAGLALYALLPIKFRGVFFLRMDHIYKIFVLHFFERRSRDNEGVGFFIGIDNGPGEHSRPERVFLVPELHSYSLGARPAGYHRRYHIYRSGIGSSGIGVYEYLGAGESACNISPLNDE